MSVSNPRKTELQKIFAFRENPSFATYTELVRLIELLSDTVRIFDGVDLKKLQFLKGDTGVKGDKPEKGVDYFTEEEIKLFHDELLVKAKEWVDALKPQKGIDYFDGKDGKDGKDGSDGQSASVSDVIEKLTSDGSFHRFISLTLSDAEYIKNIAEQVNKAGLLLPSAFDMVELEKLILKLIGKRPSPFSQIPYYQVATAGNTGGTGAAVWGTITGTLSSQTDLMNALNQRFNKTTDDSDDITEGASNLFMTTAERSKLGFITVTQPVDLDQMEADIAALANGMVYKGNWDASAGTFPGAGLAKIGWFYTVSVGGTVDGVIFFVGDRLIALANNASTTTYAGNWSKLDATDEVTSVFGRIGNVVPVAGDYNASQITNTPSGAISAVTVQAAINELDTEKQSTSEKNEDNGYAGLQTGFPNNELRLWENGALPQYQIDGIHRRSVAPTVNDDASTSYLVNDLWICDSGADKGLYYCQDNSDGAAVWIKIANVGVGGGGSPAGSDKQLQFNNAGAFGAALLQYIASGLSISLYLPPQTVTDTNGHTITIYGADGNGTGSGGHATLNGGADGTYTENGAVVNAGGGVSSSRGGDAEIFSGDGSTQAGSIYLQAGSSAGTGGNVVLQAGDGATDGTIQLRKAGSATTSIIDVSSLTANRTHTLPDESGTFAMKETTMGVVVHGATAGTARPTGYAVVTWIGSVEPTNAADNDIWYET